jgi:D-alanyl-D-alanine carboxypeptidase
MLKLHAETKNISGISDYTCSTKNKNAMSYNFKINFLKMQMFILLCTLFSVKTGFAESNSGAGASDTTSYIRFQGQFPIDSSFGILVNNESHIRGGLLFDATTRNIVWQKDLYYAYPIASLTKMMVALLTVEDINNCKVDWDDEITITKQYIKRVKRKKVTYLVNETYTLDALFHLAMIASNNEACVYIARHLNGSVDDFVSRMNTRARELQMNNTYYSNPSGLPAGKNKSALDNSSSPYDLLLLSLEMLKYPEITKVTSIGYADIANDKTAGIYRNHNHLVIDYEKEVDGLKTGYTKNARFCLAASSYKANHRLISIVLGSYSPYERNEIVADMLSNYYEKIGVGRLANNIALNKSVTKVGVDDASANEDSNATYKTVWSREKSFHTVRRGETLSSIAGEYNASVTAVKKWNHLSKSTIVKGQRLLVYVNVEKRILIKEDEIQKDGEDEEATASQQEENIVKQKPVVKAQPPKQEVAPKPITNFVYHTVQPGDTLWNIAQKYKGVTVAQIKKTNKISSAKGLKAGTKLKIILNG